MQEKHSQGPWQAEHVHPAIDGEATWRTSPPRIEGQGGAIAIVVTAGKSGDEVRANAHLLAAAPAMVRALAVLVFDPKISTYLKENDPKAFNQANDALGQAGVLS